MSALHPSFLLAGLGLGMLAALAGWRWPPARGRSLAAGGVLAVVVLAARTRTPAAAVALPVGGAAIGFALAQVRPRRRAPVDGQGRLVAGGWLLAAVLVATVWAYLSVADTEGAVLVGGLVVAGGAPWLVARWRAPATEVGMATGSLAGAVLVAGLGSTWTPGGWLAAKVVMVALYAAALAAHRLGARSGVTSAPEPPPP